MICKIKKIIIAAIIAATTTHSPTQSAPTQSDPREITTKSKSTILPVILASTATSYLFNKYDPRDCMVTAAPIIYQVGKFLTSGNKKYLTATTTMMVACKLQPKVAPIIGYSLAGCLLRCSYKYLTSKTL